MAPRTRQRLVHAAWYAAAAVVLGAVFMLYTHPDFAVMLVDQIWSCF